VGCWEKKRCREELSIQDMMNNLRYEWRGFTSSSVLVQCDSVFYIAEQQCHRVSKSSLERRFFFFFKVFSVTRLHTILGFIYYVCRLCILDDMETLVKEVSIIAKRITHSNINLTEPTQNRVISFQFSLLYYIYYIYIIIYIYILLLYIYIYIYSKYIYIYPKLVICLTMALQSVHIRHLRHVMKGVFRS